MLALIIVLVGGLSAFMLRRTVAHKDQVISRYSHDLLVLDDLIAANEHAARKARSFLLTGNPRFLRERQRANQEMERQLAELKAREQLPEGKLLLERVEELEATLRREHARLLAAALLAAAAGRGRVPAAGVWHHRARRAQPAGRRAHGGKVLVESTREQGTVFTVRLPRMPVSPDKLPRA